MKTFQEFFGEIVNSEELKIAYEAAAKSGDEAVEAFLKANGCEATVDDIRNFFKGERKKAELSEDEMAAVAGGVSLHTDIEPELSGVMPWQCNPHYSSMKDKNGIMNPILICA